MFRVLTQEAGTGEWFAVVEYHGESAEQWDAACSLADTLRHIGLYAKATKDQQPIRLQEES